MPIPDEERCKHGEVAAWCGECYVARLQMPGRVWRTQGGEVFHRKPTCEALVDGQRLAKRRGMTASTPEQVPLSEAMSAGLAECVHCFPYNVPPDAKPCKVLVEGKWVDGFLLRWLRQPDGRWKGVVNYRWEETGRRESVMEASKLKPDKR